MQRAAIHLAKFLGDFLTLAAHLPFTFFFPPGLQCLAPYPDLGSASIFGVWGSNSTFLDCGLMTNLWNLNYCKYSWTALRFCSVFLSIQPTERSHLHYPNDSFNNVTPLQINFNRSPFVYSTNTKLFCPKIMWGAVQLGSYVSTFLDVSLTIPLEELFALMSI